MGRLAIETLGMTNPNCTRSRFSETEHSHYFRMLRRPRGASVQLLDPSERSQIEPDAGAVSQGVERRPVRNCERQVHIVRGPRESNAGNGLPKASHERGNSA